MLMLCDIARLSAERQCTLLLSFGSIASVPRESISQKSTQKSKSSWLCRLRTYYNMRQARQSGQGNIPRTRATIAATLLGQASSTQAFVDSSQEASRLDQQHPQPTPHERATFKSFPELLGYRGSTMEAYSGVSIMTARAVDHGTVSCCTILYSPLPTQHRTVPYNILAYFQAQ